MTKPRYAIVTGAASGLGRAISLRLARDGWHLALADINESGAAETKTLVEQAGGTAQVESLDVAEESSWQALSQKLRGEWPRLDALVNNAGVVVSGSVEEVSIADWDWLLSINLRGVILGCHTMLDWLKANPGRSHIVNMASVAGLCAPPRMVAYNVAKAGVVSLSETMYQDLKRHNVAVTVVCPWFVKTNLLDTGRFAKVGDKVGGAAFMDNSGVTPEAVANKAVRAMYRGKLYAVVGFRARRFWLMKRHFPETYAKLAEWIHRRFIERRM